MNNKANTASPRRVALYAKFSTDMQNPMSVEDQFRLAEQYADREGWIIVERFYDRAISGTASHDRADFLRLLDALSSPARWFEVVLAKLHELVDRIVVHWDEGARGHWLEIEGNLLEILFKLEPRELDAVRSNVIFAEVGCGSLSPPKSAPSLEQLYSKWPTATRKRTNASGPVKRFRPTA